MLFHVVHCFYVTFDLAIIGSGSFAIGPGTRTCFEINRHPAALKHLLIDARNGRANL